MRNEDINLHVILRGTRRAVRKASDAHDTKLNGGDIGRPDLASRRLSRHNESKGSRNHLSILCIAGRQSTRGDARLVSEDKIELFRQGLYPVKHRPVCHLL